MFANRTRQSASKVSSPLQAETLEDRNVLSASGLLPTVTEMTSAPPLAALVRTVDDIAPLLDSTIGTASAAVNAAPLPGLATLPGLLDGGLFAGTNMPPTVGTPASPGAPLPSLGLSLDFGGLQTGLQTSSITESIPLLEQVLSPIVSTVNPTTVFVAPGTGAANSGAIVSTIDSASHSGTGAKPITAVANPAAASLLTSGAPSDVAAPPSSFFVPHDLTNAPSAAVPANEFGVPAANLQNALAPVNGVAEARLAGIAEPAGVVAPDMPDSDAGSNSLIPQSAGLQNSAAPVDFAAVNGALQKFLDQLADLRQDVGSWLGSIGSTSWVLMTLAVVAAAGELLRRRLQKAQSRKLASAAAKRDAMRWFPAFHNVKEDA